MCIVDVLIYIYARDVLAKDKMLKNKGVYQRYEIEWIGREGLAPETHDAYLKVPTFSASDPDPVGSGFKLPCWIRIRIRIRNPDPDPESEIEL